MEVSDDRSLITAFRSGDEAAFDEIVDKYHKMIFGLCWRMLGSVENAEDATQQVFINVFRKADKFKGKSSFKTWLYSVAINECRNRIRKFRKYRFSELDNNTPAETEGIDEKLGTKQQKEMIRRGIERLPFKQRAVVNLRINEELPFREIASVLGSSVNSAKVNFQHGLNSLKEMIKGDLK